VNAIIALRVASHFSEALNAVELATNQWPMNWMVLSDVAFLN
jgi:hypothetical protein